MDSDTSWSEPDDRATLPTPVEDGNLKEIRGRRDEIKVTLIAKPNIHEVRVGYYQDGQWFTIAKCSTFEADEEVYARFFVNAPADIDYLLTRLSQAEAEIKRLTNGYAWYGVELGEQVRRQEQRIAELTAQVESQKICWHCGVVLAYVPKPRCEDCPDECDVENCDEMGCEAAATEGKADGQTQS